MVAGVSSWALTHQVRALSIDPSKVRNLNEPFFRNLAKYCGSCFQHLVYHFLEARLENHFQFHFAAEMVMWKTLSQRTLRSVED